MVIKLITENRFYKNLNEKYNHLSDNTKEVMHNSAFILGSVVTTFGAIECLEDITNHRFGQAIVSGGLTLLTTGLTGLNFKLTCHYHQRNKE